MQDTVAAVALGEGVVISAWGIVGVLLPSYSVVLANGVKERDAHGRGVNRKNEAFDLETVVRARGMPQICAGGGDKRVFPLIRE